MMSFSVAGAHNQHFLHAQMRKKINENNKLSVLYSYLYGSNIFRVQFRKELHSGKLQPCPTRLDWGESEWQWRIV
jgi:hypothetical protein